MKRSKFNLSLVMALVLAGLSAAALADAVEPTPDEDLDDLRDDYLQTWYIYNDENNDGILDPGDTYIADMTNWWTTVSSGTQLNSEDDAYGGVVYGDESPCSPMSFASDTDAEDNYWLDTDENTLSFYLTYSQYDNNDTWAGTASDLMEERHSGTDGYALGWVVGDIEYTETGDIAGVDMMDIYIHNGDSDEGYDSNPQVTQSNDISKSAKDPNTGEFRVPTYNEATGTYDAAVNDAYIEWFNDNGGTMDDATLAEIAASMEFKEVDPDAAGDTWSAIYADKTPEEIAANLVDDAGNPYEYQDAFVSRGTYTTNSTDGGVIGGISGESSGNIEEWGNQTVIRIDISELMLYNIDEVVFYDFTDQTNPTKIVLYVDLTRSVEDGQLYYETSDGTKIYFPENRIYIAVTTIVPEPATLGLLGLGGLAMAAIRRRRRHAA